MRVVPFWSVVFGSVDKSVQLVQILDAFSSAVGVPLVTEDCALFDGLRPDADRRFAINGSKTTVR